MEGAAARASLPVDPQGAIDYSGDFFGEKVFLTVSGQLNGKMTGRSVLEFRVRAWVFRVSDFLTASGQLNGMMIGRSDLGPLTPNSSRLKHQALRPLCFGPEMLVRHKSTACIASLTVLSAYDGSLSTPYPRPRPQVRCMPVLLVTSTPLDPPSGLRTATPAGTWLNSG